jgi:hypothetical protein
VSFKDIKSLKKAILKKAENGMHEKVLPIIKVDMIKAIYEEVYFFEPIKYIRRHHRGGYGLDDSRNMLGFLSESRNTGFDFKVVNITMPDTAGEPQVYLTPLIVLGQEGAKGIGYPLLYQDDIGSYARPRDFIGATIDKMHQGRNRLAGQLEDFMNK